MSEEKTPEQAAETWAREFWDDGEIDATVREHAVSCGAAGFLAGRTHFIENELRELLEAAREEYGVSGEYDKYEIHFTHSIDDIIKKAKDPA